MPLEVAGSAPRRSEKAERFVEELSKKVRSRAPNTMFEMILLTKIEANPDATIRDCWRFTNEHFRDKAEERGERYEYKKYDLDFNN